MARGEGFNANDIQTNIVSQKIDIESEYNVITKQANDEYTGQNASMKKSEQNMQDRIDNFERDRMGSMVGGPQKDTTHLNKQENKNSDQLKLYSIDI
ncbi:MAG: hypothetical protein RLZZ86_3107 [Cyanobacteriota bacterium]